MTTKQRAYLRSLASGISPVFQIGKGGLTDESIKQIGNAVNARELIKCSVLETCPLNAGEAAQAVSEGTGAECVQVIGNRFVLYKRNEKKPKIEL